MKRIQNSRETAFLGRNGTGKCAGFDFFKSNDNNSVVVTPLTSKMAMGRCEIQIPLEDLQEFVKALMEAGDE